MSSSPPPITKPKLVEIDNALAELEPALEQFGSVRGFVLSRGYGCSANIPRRWLLRFLPGLRHEVGLVIASSVSDRLEHGFHPGVPCTLYITAQLYPSPPRDCQVYHAKIVEAEPFNELLHSLPRHLAVAVSRLDACTVEFVNHHGRAFPT